MMRPTRKHNNPPDESEKSFTEGVTFTRGPMHINTFTKYQNAELTL